MLAHGRDALSRGPLPKGVLEIKEYVCPSPATEEWGEAFDRLREQNFARQVRRSFDVMLMRLALCRPNENFVNCFSWRITSKKQVKNYGNLLVL